MKTKPHGYTTKNWQEILSKKDNFIEVHAGNDHYETGYCLLHPAICDRLREFLQNVESGVGYTRQQAAELLKLLPEVEK